MRIWYLNHYAGGPGIGRYARSYHLARAWAVAGHETTVVMAAFHHLLDGVESAPAEQVVGGVRYVALPARPYQGNGARRFLNMIDYSRGVGRLEDRIAGLGQPDVVIVSTPHPFAIFVASRIARRHGARLVFEVRDLWSLSMREINGASAAHPVVALSRLAERHAYRHADLVASLLPGAGPYLEGEGVPADRQVFVPNGIDFAEHGSQADPVSAAGRQAAGLIEAWRGEGRTIVIHPGAQGRANALDLIVDAVAMRGGDGRDLGVLLLGSGEMTDALRIRSAAIGTDTIRLVDAVPKSEAMWLTERCDVGYAGGRDRPNVYRYGIAFNKLLDFMRASLPVILPLRSGNDPVTRSGCGMVVDSDPVAIARCLDAMVAMGVAARREMGARGHAFAREHYDYRQIANTYAQAIGAAPEPNRHGKRPE